MNHSPFWPLVWKEYRSGRAFWLAMSVMGVVAQAGVWWLGRPSYDRDAWLYQIALMISAGFAVGIGATLFAAENEEHTIALLRRLPVRAEALGGAKLLAAMVGLGALLAVLWLAACGLAGSTLIPRDAQQLWASWGLACAEGLAWGVFFSLVIPRPLWATLVAALAIVLADVCLGWPDRSRSATLDYGHSTFYRTALLAVVALIDAILLPSWHLGKDVRCQRRLAVRKIKITLRPSVRHLAWQTIQEGKASFLLWIAVTLVVFVASLTEEIHRIRFFFGPAVIWPLVAALGALVFRADQSNGPRFLAQRGASPRAIWFSRHLVWGGGLLILIAVLSLIPLLSLAGNLREIFNHGGYAQFAWRVGLILAQILAFFVPLLTVYAAGQFASLLVSRSLLAMTLAVLLGGLLGAWYWLMEWIGASIWWSELPLAVGFLLATYLRMPTWLIERGGWRAWVAPLAAALVPVAALAIAVPAYRVWQIPLVQSGLVAPAAGASAVAEALATLEKYREAYDRWRSDRPAAIEKGAPTTVNADMVRALEHQRLFIFRSDMLPDEANWHEQFAAWAKPVYDLALEASQRQESLLVLSVVTRAAGARQIEEMTKFLVDYGKVEQVAGNFDAALEAHLAALRSDVQRYACDPSGASLHPQIFEALQLWGAESGQSAERVRGAIEALEAWHAKLPKPNDLLLPMYQVGELTIDDLPRAAAAEVITGITDAQWITSRLGWERDRARRVLNLWTSWQLDGADQVALELSENGRFFLTGPAPIYSFGGSQLMSTPLVARSPIAMRSVAWQIFCHEVDYRATLIVLALEAWRIENGGLPRTLDELVGHGLERLPLDPGRAEPFDYASTAQQALFPYGWSSPSGVQGAGKLPPFIRSDFSSIGPHARGEAAGQNAPELIEFGASGARVVLLDQSGPRTGTIYLIPDVWETQP